MFKGDFSKWSALQKAARHVSPGGKKQKRPLIDSPENILTLEKAAAKQKVSRVNVSVLNSSARAQQAQIFPSYVQTKKKKTQNRNTSQEVKRIKEKLPEYLADSVRASTKKTYKSFWLRYKKFCASHNLVIHDAESISVFLISLAESTDNKKSSTLAKHAIKFYLKLQFPFKKSPTDTYFVSRILKSISKKYGKPVKKAKGVSSVLVKKIVLKLLNSGSFKDERTAVFILLQFLFMGRFEEMSGLTKSCVTFLPQGHIQVFFPSAKNYEKWDAKTAWVKGNAGDAIDPLKIVQSL